MNTKDAIQLAARAMGQQVPHKDIAIDLDKVWAESPHGGVQVKLDANIGLKLRVPGEQLLKAVKALDEPTVEKGKGATVKVHEGSLQFSIKGRLISDPVEIEDGASVLLDDLEYKAVLAAGKMIDPTDKVNPILSGLHLSPNWVGGANQMMAWVVWVACVGEAVTVAPDAFTLVEGAPAVWVKGRRLYARSSDVTQWATPFAADYPSGGVMEMLASGREHAGKTVVKIDPVACKQLFKAAQAAARAPAEPFRLSLNGTTLTVKRPQDDLPEFHGVVECARVFRHEATGEEIGLTPAAVLRAFDLCVEPDAEYYLAVGGKLDKLSLWGGDKVKIEIVIFPSFLP